MVRLFYPDYVQVGYFGLAQNVYFSISTGISQLTIAFAPFMIILQAQGDTKTLKQWIEHLIIWLSVGVMLVVFGVLLLGNDLVPLVLGISYQPVAANLLPLSIALWFHVLGNMGILLTIVCNRPKIAVMAAAIRLATIWVFGPLLVVKWGSLGGCFTVLFAMVLYAYYLTWHMKRMVTYSLRKWALAIALGFIFLPLLWLQSSWPVNVTLYGVFLIGYGSLLFFLQIVTPAEVVAVWRAFGSKSGKFNWPKSMSNEYLDR
jgi:O-antigen/teichoic acid export membrane protein